MSTGFRLRVKFAETAQGAFLAHREVLDTIDRVVRRAQLPYAITEGFHPRIKIAFGPALSVGIGSEGEYFDVWLASYLPCAEALRRLQAAAPRALPVRAVGYVAPREMSLSAALTLFSYRATVVAPNIEACEVERAFTAVRQLEKLEVERKNKVKVFEPSRCIPNDAVVTQQGATLEVAFTLRGSSEGLLRPEILLERVFSLVNGSYERLTLVRTGLFIETDEGWVPPL